MDIKTIIVETLALLGLLAAIYAWAIIGWAVL